MDIDDGILVSDTALTYVPVRLTPEEDKFLTDPVLTHKDAAVRAVRMIDMWDAARKNAPEGSPIHAVVFSPTPWDEESLKRLIAQLGGGPNAT